MPPSERTIDDSISELKAQQRARAAAGITATLGCEPPAAVGRVSVRVHAQFFASEQVLATLAPVLRCEEIADVGGIPMERTRRAGEYVLALPSAELAKDATYHLTLHPDPKASASARYTLHTFSNRVVAAARSELRGILSLETGEGRPTRKPRDARK